MNKSDDQRYSSSLSTDQETQDRLSPANRILRWIGRISVTLLGSSILVVLLLRWVNPPTTSFMLQYQFNNDDQTEQRWTTWENISPHIKMAAIASEDQNFAVHWGLDTGSIQKAITEYERGRDLRGASTITQQVAKNLFLWGGRSYIRKGIEAYLALLIEFLWPKKRILEVYLNIAEFGKGIYGVHAAARHFFNTSPGHLTKWQSACMVTALPAPRRYNLADPSEYMLQRSAWVMRYMDLLGNSHYLDRLK